jgi:hypothetical protein
MARESLAQLPQSKGVRQSEIMAKYDESIQARKFYGQVILTYEDGRLVNVKETRNLKPDQLVRVLGDNDVDV